MKHQMMFLKIIKPHCLTQDKNMRHLLSLALLVLLTGCAAPPPEKVETAETKARLELIPASYSDMPGWGNDNAAAALVPFAKSCARILKIDPVARPTMSAAWAGPITQWQEACKTIPPVTATPAQARQYFETYFKPVAATADGKAEGLFTGYYEASLKGSSTKSGPYQIPLRARPDDLVMVNLGEFREELKGQRIAGRVVGGNLKVYEDHAAIVDGKLPVGMDKPLLWVDSAVDAFFLQIQGSGAVTLQDGSVVRVGYDGQNGHPYYAIGKELVKRGYLAQKDVSMQSIQEWLAKNPVEGREVMRLNKSYVFFRILDKEGAIGGEGLPLTAGRSLAIDRSIIPYGLPVYVDLEGAASPQPRIQRLMIAQDTGGAIVGPVRGDVFWGYGPEAEHNAGLMKSRGRYWFLMPR
jgi:membrane-bound lytic murein transglycosylase A